MLVLRRLCGQSIAIGENAEIIVKVLRNENGVVSIGVDAPGIVKVNRLEVYKKFSNRSSSFLYRKNASKNKLNFKNSKKFTSDNDPAKDQDICSS